MSVRTASRWLLLAALPVGFFLLCIGMILLPTLAQQDPEIRPLVLYWNQCADVTSASAVTVNNCNAVRFTGTTTVNTINTCDVDTVGRVLRIICGTADTPFGTSGNIKVSAGWTCRDDETFDLWCTQAAGATYGWLPLAPTETGRFRILNGGLTMVQDGDTADTFSCTHLAGAGGIQCDQAGTSEAITFLAGGARARPTFIIGSAAGTQFQFTNGIVNVGSALTVTGTTTMNGAFNATLSGQYNNGDFTYRLGANIVSKATSSGTVTARGEDDASNNDYWTETVAGKRCYADGTGAAADVCVSRLAANEWGTDSGDKLTGKGGVDAGPSTAADQLRVLYDASNRLDVTVDSAGFCTLDAVGSVPGFNFTDVATVTVPGDPFYRQLVLAADGTDYANLGTPPGGGFTIWAFGTTPRVNLAAGTPIPSGLSFGPDTSGGTFLSRSYLIVNYNGDNQFRVNRSNAGGGSGTILSIDSSGNATWNVSTAAATHAFQNNAATVFSFSNTSIDAVTKKISNVVDPTLAQDAATKNYVDTKAPRVLAQSTTQVGNTALTETSLWSYSVPASTLATNGDSLDLWIGGQFGSTVSLDKRLIVKFGALEVFNSGALTGAQNQEWRVECNIIRTGAATQKATCSLSTSGVPTGVNYVDYTTPAETLSGAVTLDVRGNGTNANDTVFQLGKVSWSPGV